jgi:hypothetical protein
MNFSIRNSVNFIQRSKAKLGFGLGFQQFSLTSTRDAFNSARQPLMLMDMKRTQVPHLFELIWLRLTIRYQMYQLDPTFSVKEFLDGSQQVYDSMIL